MNEGEILTQKENDKKNKQPFAYDVVSVICTAVIVIMVAFTFFFRFVGVVGDSMVPTLENNDWLLVHSKSSYEYGDIIISSQPNAFNEPIVKRVIATGGQTVDIDFERGVVSVDGVELDEPYTRTPTTSKYDVEFPIYVPEGYIFVLGDNRNDSMDSRDSRIGEGGLVDTRYVLGHAVLRVFPFSSFGRLDNK